MAEGDVHVVRGATGWRIEIERSKRAPARSVGRGETDRAPEDSEVFLHDRDGKIRRGGRSQPAAARTDCCASRRPEARRCKPQWNRPYSLSGRGFTWPKDVCSVRSNGGSWPRCSPSRRMRPSARFRSPNGAPSKRQMSGARSRRTRSLTLEPNAKRGFIDGSIGKVDDATYDVGDSLQVGHLTHTAIVSRAHLMLCRWRGTVPRQRIDAAVEGTAGGRCIQSGGLVIWISTSFWARFPVVSHARTTRL